MAFPSNTSCIAANTSVGYLLEVAKKWGIHAAMFVASAVFIGFITLQLYEENKANKAYIQTELMKEVKESTASRTELSVILRETNSVLEETTHVLKQFTPPHNKLTKE